MRCSLHRVHPNTASYGARRTPGDVGFAKGQEPAAAQNIPSNKITVSHSRFTLLPVISVKALAEQPRVARFPAHVAQNVARCAGGMALRRRDSAGH